ncbi:plastidic glucose transporter 4 [Stachybotrys elegans]|uniref:Plastidic glucose transporter 4 n=1 Tax=Stachybotrys elegans TaxID=80388 RepID=A0A8K0WUF3_9HYPO|nr:plastidic glucose transporter 4 [Stachybotrys elegans]
MPEPRPDVEAPTPPSGARRPSSSDETYGTYGTYDTHNEKGGPSTAALLRNPLEGMSEEDVLADVDAFVHDKGLSEHREDFRKGALLARVNGTSDGFEAVTAVSESEKEILRREITHRWSQPFTLYFLCTLCAGSAVVQGMDQTAVNGAQQYYYDEFDIRNEYMQGLMNGAPYLCSVLIGCWTNPFLNKIGGRRFTIFVSCVFSFLTSIWMGVADSYWNLFAARFCLGFAVGAKSSTTPVYSAECTPKTIRGALTMMWQMWTAFGICLGFVVSVAFQNADFLGEYSQWRWMLGSTGIPPLIVMAQVYFCPESPRWYMEKGRYDRAYRSMCRLRHHPIQAARDMYYSWKLLEIERKEREGRNLLKEFFTVRRNRRAAQSAWFTMFMQQFCGVNVIAYYSTSIFESAGFSRSSALLASMGGGLINWLFAIPAIYTIDTFGRRNLLLVSFPLMSLCLFFTAFAFLAETEVVRTGLVMTGLYLFMVVYSPGEGPVPFTYSAEAFPLHIRDIGMSSSTAVCWGFNFIISFSWPPLQRAFGDTGAFCWYAAWNLFGWVFAYFMLPETKNLTLEELDSVFGVTNRTHSGYYFRKLPWYANKHILRQDVAAFPPLYEFAEETVPNEKAHSSHVEGLMASDRR